MTITRSRSGYPDDAPLIPIPSEAESTKAPLILILIIVTMFLPEETSFRLGDFRMTLTRLLLLLAAPAVIVRFVGLMGQERYRFVWSDAVVPITGLWMFLGPIANEPLGDALKYSGSCALEFCVPYMAARSYLSKRGEAVALVRVLCSVIAIVGLMAISDEIARRFLLRETIGSLTGYVKKGFEGGQAYDLNEDMFRGFLVRATSTLEHPILLGAACVIGLVLTIAMRGTAFRLFSFLGAGTGLALSVSSAPLICAVVGFSAMSYEKITRSLPFRWSIIFGALTTLCVIIFLVHPHPIGFLISHMVLDPQTGFYRLLQWECAGEFVMNSPILGIGLSDEWASECELTKSVDSLWLNSAMIFGIPGSALIGASYIGACSLPTSIDNDELNLTDQERYLGFLLGLILALVIFMGFTVHFWGTVYILTIFLAGIRAHLGALGATPREAELDDFA
jgi:hypothetical protein